MCTDWMEIERKREPNTVCDTSSHRIEIERKREPNTVYNTCVCLIGTHRMCEHVSHTVLGSRFLSVSIQSVHIQCANIHSSNVWTYTRIIHCVGLSLSFCLYSMRTCITHCVGLSLSFYLHSIGTHRMCEHTLVLYTVRTYTRCVPIGSLSPERESRWVTMRTTTCAIHCVGLSLSFCVHSIGTHRMCEHTLVLYNVRTYSRCVPIGSFSQERERRWVNVRTYTRTVHCVGLSLSLYLHLMGTPRVCENIY